MVYMPHWPKSIILGPREINLDNIKAALSLLGNPEKKLPCVIHVTGTNGKGSTSTFLSTILMRAGYKVGLYTSPHLIDVNERISINGVMIYDNVLFDLLEECRIKLDEIRASFFEYITAAAFLYFSRMNLDFLVLEIGMGGRFDATNVVDSILAIITSISLDHQEYLGSTEESIAFEKSGIMRKGVPCVISAQSPEVFSTLESVAKAVGAYVYREGVEWKLNSSGDGFFIYTAGGEDVLFKRPALEGMHQIRNAGTAIAAASILAGRYGFSITFEDMQLAITDAYWPGRLEKIKNGVLAAKLPKKWLLYFDGAHNQGGGEVIRKWKEDNYPEYKTIAIVGVTKGKNINFFFNALGAVLSRVFAVSVKSETNSYGKCDLASAVSEINGRNFDVSSALSIGEAFESILSSESHDDKILIIVCGSLYLLRDMWLEGEYIKR